MDNNEMRSPFDERIAEVGQALAHPYRIQILRLLSKGELCGCEIVPHFQLDQSGISRHLNALRRARLITPRRDGVRVYWHLSSSKVKDLLQLLEAKMRENNE
ncbi:MAG TPA: transcriptional regulator [Candidatus Acetothermia bacterium]|nr:transcriptional regulator [Candidatus Acetothermia bacterium]HEX32594.1 transcriptional regulator [Candidatus Acetothermia bacterium]